MKITRREFIKGFGVLAAGAVAPPAFEVPEKSSLRVNAWRFEAIDVITKDGTEFIAGDPVQVIQRVVAYGVSGREYEVFPGTPAFDALLEVFS